jgi:hypothetical protein
LLVVLSLSSSAMVDALDYPQFSMVAKLTGIW